MSCTIPYLRNLPLEEGTIAKLEEIDIDIKSELLSSGLFTIIKPNGLQLMLISANKELKEKQLEFIRKLNNQYPQDRTKQKGIIRIENIKLENNKPINNVVVVDVRVHQDANLNQEPPLEVDDNDMRLVLESFLKPPFEVKETTFEEYVTDDKKVANLTKMIGSLFEKVETFQGNFTEFGKPINSQFSSNVYDQLNRMRFLAEKIKNEDLVENLYQLNSLIFSANKILNSVVLRYEQTKQKIKELESISDRDEYLKNQKDIGEFFIELRELQHVLNFLSDFHVNNSDKNNPWSNRNIFQFEKGLREIVAKLYPDNTNKQNREYVEFILSNNTEDYTTIIGKLREQLKKDNIIVNDLFDQVHEVYKSSKKDNKSIIATIEESHYIISELKTNAVELQKDYLAEVIHSEVKELYDKDQIFESDKRVSNYATDPKIKAIVRNAGLGLDVLQIKGVTVNNDDFFKFFRDLLVTRQVTKENVDAIISIMESNKVNDKRAMFYATKEKIRGLLSLAEKDMDITDRFFEQRSQFDDIIVSTVAVLVQKELMKGDLENKLSLQEATRMLQSIGLSISDPKRKQYEELFQQEIVYIDDNDKLELATAEDIAFRNFIEVEGLKKGELIPYKARRGNAFVVEHNFGDYSAKRKIFEETLLDRTNNIFQLIKDKKFDDISKLNYTSFLNLFSTDRLGNKSLRGKFDVNSTKLESDIKKSIMKALRADFYSTNLKSRDNAIDILINKTTAFEDLAALLNEKGNSYFNYNTNIRELKSGELKQLIDEQKFTRSDLANHVSQGTNILVKVKEGEEFRFETVDLQDTYWEGLDVVGIYRYSNNLQVPINQNPAWIKLNQNLNQLSTEEKDKALKYYDFLVTKYRNSNNNLEAERVRHYLIQVPKIETKTLKDRLLTGLESIANVFKNLKYEEPNITPRLVRDEFGNLVRGSRDGRVLEPNEPTEFKTKQFLSGETNRRIKPTFANNITYEESEKDLFLSMHLFNASTTEYSKKRIAEPLVLTLSTMFKGDTTIGIEQRKAKIELFNKTTLQTGNNQDAVKPAKQSIAALERFMESYIYDEMVKDYNIKGVSAKKVTNFFKGLINFQVLAGNIISPVGNYLTGQTNNFLLSQGKKFGLSEKLLGDALLEYNKNVAIGQFMKDSFQTDITKQSKISQLILFFDAIKGDMLDLRSQVIPKNLLNRTLSYEKLFLGTSLAEHANQVPLMMAILKGTKLGDTNLYDIIEKKEGEFFEFNWEKAGIADDPAAQKKIILNTLTNITAANFSAHGQYAIMSKNEIQGNALLSMGLVLSNWIYPFLKTRYGKSEFNRFAKEFGEDGYQRQFLRSLFTRTNEALSEIQDYTKEEKTFKNYIKSIYKSKAIKAVPLDLLESLFKQPGFILDRLTGSSISKNSTKFNEWLYGDKSLDEYEQKRIALVRASSELTFFVGATLLGLYLNALHDDDEEEVGDVVKVLELFTARYANDTGQFLIASSPSSVVDWTLRKSKDPFAIARALDTNFSLIAQLIGWDFTEEGINFNIDDRYAKSGNGYEKGDLKIDRKLMKSVFSPLYQIYRFGELDDQLQYVKLLNKNSSNQNTNNEEELEQFAENREE
jgi:hypothetical protein